VIKLTAGERRLWVAVFAAEYLRIEPSPSVLIRDVLAEWRAARAGEAALVAAGAVDAARQHVQACLLGEAGEDDVMMLDALDLIDYPPPDKFKPFVVPDGGES
jgi:hypothetical protein